MKRVLWFAMLGACGGGGSGDDFPVVPGGPSGPNTPLDASLVDARDPDALATVAGRVCLAPDPRTPTAPCATTGAGGITVTLGTKTAMTAADGSFQIASPGGSNLVWRAERAGTLVTSLMPFGLSNIIPAMTPERYFELQNANSIVVAGGRGSIFARVVKNATPQAGVNAEVSPLSDLPPRYASTAPLSWPELATGTTSFGMLWIANAVPGNTTVTGTPDAGAAGAALGPVEDQAITYLTIDLP